MKRLRRVALIALWAALAPSAALVLDAWAQPGVPPQAVASALVGQHYGSDGGRSGGLATRAVQKEIERMAARADLLARSDAAGAEEVDEGLEDVEEALETRVGNDQALAEEIRATRGALCAKQGFHSHERAECERFMRGACLPDEEREEQPGQAAQLLPVDVCRQFFVDVEGGSLAWSAPAAAPAPSPLAHAAQAPAAAPPEWFSKELQGLPEQGLSGDPKVLHEDANSWTSDWQREFGSKAGHRTYREICREHPDNEWCRLHMSYDGPEMDMASGWARSTSARGYSSLGGQAPQEKGKEQDRDEGRGTPSSKDQKDKKGQGSQEGPPGALLFAALAGISVLIAAMLFAALA